MSNEVEKVDTTGMKIVVVQGVHGYDRKQWVAIGFAGPGKEGKVPIYLLDGTPVGKADKAARRLKLGLALEAGQARRDGKPDVFRLATKAEIESRYGYSKKR